MRIIKIHDRTVPISRYSDPATPAGNLTTTALALLTDFRMNGDPVVGFGFTSIGRFGQSGLIQERFAPRLLAATENELAGADGPIDPERAWKCLMRDEKPGGHGERCVAVGALDMALWDIAAKIAGKPLYRFLRDRLGRTGTGNRVAVYAGGGYYFESHDSERLKEEVRRFLDLGYTKIKIKIGGRPLAKDIARIEAVLSLLPNGGCLAVDAMNRYTTRDALETAKTLEPYSLRWFEDICDPQDFETNRRIAEAYRGALAAGEAIFSLADARNLLRYAGLRTNHDVLVFDPAHCYGLPEFLRIIEAFEAAGWSRTAFQPQGAIYSLCRSQPGWISGEAKEILIIFNRSVDFRMTLWFKKVSSRCRNPRESDSRHAQAFANSFNPWLWVHKAISAVTHRRCSKKTTAGNWAPFVRLYQFVNASKNAISG